MADREGVVRFANSAVERLLSLPSGALMGTRLGFPLGVDESCEIDVVVGQSAGTAEVRVVAIEWEGEVALLASLAT